jgi:hypothetical protein
MYGSSQALPYIILSLPIGALVDRRRRRTLILAAGTVSMLALASILIAHTVGAVISRCPTSRRQRLHTHLAAAVNLPALGDLVTHRETGAGQQADRLREQIATLTAELGRVDSELAALATTRTTLRALAAAEFTADDPTFASTPYQQILEVLATAPAGMRAKGICLALGVEPSPKHVEGTRAKLKRMENPQVLTQDETGVFALAPKRT